MPEETNLPATAAHAAQTTEAAPVAVDSTVTKEENEAAEQADNKRKRSNRAKTGKDRREFAKARAVARKEADESQPPSLSESRTEPRLPKRKVALMIGYCGSGYQGMQVNPGAHTIEGELFKALCGAGAVSEENSVDQQKIQLQRAARTDKGVHAAGQVVSAKLIIEDPDVIQKINQGLPDQIRLWGFVKANRSFNAKTACDSRVYEYMLPTYLFLEPAEKNKEIARTVEFMDRQVPVSTAEEMRKKREYRAPQETLEFVRSAFARYKGTHDYRNFTVTRGCTENNSKRYIHWFEVSEPMVIRDAEWLSLKVKGQSFMLHQIRKMVGLIVLMARAGAPLDLIDTLFSGPRVNVPKAPGLGLLLEQPVFDGYNKRAAAGKTTAPTDPIDFAPFAKEMDEFKQRFIYDRIIQTEMEEATFDDWAAGTEVFPEQYLYINPEGTIPESTIVIPGQERSFPRRPAATTEATSTADSDEEGHSDS
ncbi:tRNA pseudouridine synthase 1 [Coemansia sp. RSA 552]|nr:tRNA pseudouridine synthase 1 [Coemansia sp. RSA 552]